MSSSTELQDQNKIHIVPLLVVVIGAFMSFLDSSIVNVALPHMMSVLGVSSSDIQWVLTAYMLTSGIVIPTSAFLCKRFGHRRVYVVALAIFTVGSALCGISWNLSTIIAARIIQAIGGGLVIPVSMAMVYFLAPREKMGMAMGIWGLGAILGPSIGPTLGGYIVDTVSWEWIFFVNVPIGILTVFLCPFYLKETPVDKNVKFDLLGTIFIAASCFSLLLALSKGTDWGWRSQSIISLFLISGFVFVAFFVWEASVEHPLIDVRVFKNKVVLASMATMSLLTIGMMGVIFIIPLYSENLLGNSPLKTGLIMLPMALVSAVMMPISGKLYDKLGAFKIGLVGIIVAGITTYQLQSLGLDTASKDLQIMLALRSFGFGLALMPIGNTAMAAVPQELASSTSAVVNTVRQVAGSMGIAAISYQIVVKQAYHQSVMRDLTNYGSYAAVKTVSQLQAAFAAAGSDPVTAQGQALGTINGWIARQGMMDAMNDSIVVIVLMMILSIPLTFLLSPKHVEEARLHQQNQIRQHLE